MCFFFQAEDGIRDYKVTGVQTCALPISPGGIRPWRSSHSRNRSAVSKKSASRAASAEQSTTHAGAIKELSSKIGRASCRERVNIREDTVVYDKTEYVVRSLLLASELLR